MRGVEGQRTEVELALSKALRYSLSLDGTTLRSRGGRSGFSLVYTVYTRVITMLTKVFKSGNSQAIRIPKELQLPEGEVEILKRGDEIVIRPFKGQSAAILFDILASMEGGPFEREEFKFQEREFDPSKVKKE